MAGKNTSKSEHDSRLAELLPDEKLSTETIKKLSNVLGCEITSDMAYTLEKLIENYKNIRAISSAHVTTQDIKSTLKGMMKLDEVSAAVAYKNCDSSTESHISREIHLMDEEGLKPSLIEAIKRANNYVNKLKQVGGRPNNTYIPEFVGDCLVNWTAWTDKPITCSYNDYVRYDQAYDDFGKASDTLEWCHILVLKLIEGQGKTEYNYKELAKIITKHKM